MITTNKYGEKLIKNKTEDFIDKSNWIRFFGVTEILLGILALILTLYPFLLRFFFNFNISVLSSLLEMFYGLAKRLKIPIAVFYTLPLRYYVIYGLTGLLLITCGIGSIKIRKWARAIILIFSILSIFYCMTDLAYDSLYGESIFRALTKRPWDTYYYLFISLFLLFFYSRTSIKNTFYHHDFKHSWVENCPLPILGFSIFYICGAVNRIIYILSGNPELFFGVIFTGTTARVIFTVTFFVYIFLAYGLYKLKIKAWLILFIINIFYIISSLTTLAMTYFEDIYLKLGFSKTRLNLMKNYFFSDMRYYEISNIIGQLLIVGYLFYILKFFKKTPFHPRGWKNSKKPPN